MDKEIAKSCDDGRKPDGNEGNGRDAARVYLLIPDNPCSDFFVCTGIPVIYE
jgi:hypothetical protein